MTPRKCHKGKPKNEPAEELDLCQELQEEGNANREEGLRRLGSKLKAKELGTKLIEVRLEKDLVGEGAWQPGERDETREPVRAGGERHKAAGEERVRGAEGHTGPGAVITDRARPDSARTLLVTPSRRPKVPGP